ncbi:shikimate dehydrogenase [Sandaracinobacter sp.]|uniref:shikimate dehydrogenase n=1 Tax=Sandaracinobacter sp. TaxID=2487581 RepID=UPI0035AE67C1
MRTAGVIGWPIAHSKSPAIHRFWLRALGIDGDYSRFAVRPDELGAAVRALPALGIAGVNVTVPHKVAVLDWLDGASAEAAAIGAVNTVLVRDGGLWGTNTDIEGFAGPLAGRHVEHAVVVGAGGAARAVLPALARLGVRRITVMNRSVAKARALLEGLEIEGDAVPLAAAAPDADLLVNASSLGMKGEPPLRLDLGALPDGATVYDIVYAPLETELLAAARARGLRTIDGLEMLVGQAAVAFELFYGAKPPRGRDAELRALLLGGGA